MRKSRPIVPMVEPEDFTKQIYICDGNEYSFAQLCCHFGLKYMAVWWKVAKNGMTVKEAIDACREDAYSWGATYSDGTLAIMNEQERQEQTKRRIETWKKTMKEKGKIQ